jgi:cellulose synthase operon protein C
MSSRRASFFVCVTLALAALFLAPASSAEPFVLHPEVQRGARQLERAKGPEVHGLLRRLLGLWDVADPGQIEATLQSYAEAPATAPAHEVYAKVLLSEARTRRGDVQGAAALIEQLGFVDRWMFVGPFDNENRTGLSIARQPEQELAEPIVPGRAFDGKERPVRWRSPPETRTGMLLDLGAYLRPRESVCGYAVSFVELPKKTELGFFVGVDGAFKLWVDEALVLEDAAYRGFDVDRAGTLVSLGAGVHRITVKLCSDTSSPKVALRLADARGAPRQGLALGADPAWSERASARLRAEKPAAKQAGAAPPKKPAQLGPIAGFEALVAAPKPRAADLEGYARYLVATRGNPIGEHRARDLAARAAELEPTVERLLLAAELAEDRNLARGWLDRAWPLVTGDRERIALTLAEARHARGGIHWPDAVPHYDAALKLDADNVVAVLGRADLHVQAGLPRTALAILEAGVARQPRALALLRAQAVQLRAVGRDTEADEVEARWYAYRADDSAFAARQLSRAVARRDAALAERWLDRLTRTEPDVVHARAVAAETWRSLGDRARARRALEAALEVAPEDTATLRSLADLSGETGQRDEQLRHLRRILALHPQSKDVRAYVEYLSPSKPRFDESLAWDRDRLLELAKRPTGRESRRTLRNLAVTTVYSNGLASRFRQVVFQPLTEEAAASSRQFGFGYQGDRQEVELRLSRVYRKDGTVAEAIESGEAAANDPSIAMYTSGRSFYVQFPRLSPGDVVELRYRIDDVGRTNEVADSFGEIETLQSDEPIASSEYVLLVPKERAITTFVTGLEGVEQEKRAEGEQVLYRFSAKDVPARTAEPAMPPWSEVLGQVHVSTFRSWEELGRWYWGLARDQLDVDDEVRKSVQKATQGLSSDADKVRAVYRLATELRYVALEFGIEGIKPRRCALTLARGWGDCKDKATVIVTMLRELGIDAQLVLVRTQQRGDLPKGAPPSIAAFDHAIAYVPSLDLYLDGTAEGSGSTELPAMDRGAVALVVDPKGARLVRLPDAGPEASPHKRRIELALAADGSASFGFETTVQGVNAATWRRRYVGAGTQRDRATRDLGSFLGVVELGKEASALVVRDAEEIERAFGLSARGRAPSFARREGDALSVPVATSLDLASTLTPLSTRTLDLVVGGLSSSEEERVLRLPGGAKLVRLPDPVRLETPFGIVSLELDTAPGRVTVKSRLALSRSRISPKDYAAFQAFCRKADEALSQRLVVQVAP